MPFNISGCRPRLVAVAVGLAAALAAAPAQAAGPVNPDGCAPQPTLAQNFAPFGDFNEYTPVANAGFEEGAASWTLSGGAQVVDGNEPWLIGGASDSHSLDLPFGASATSAPICIDETYPHFRLFVRNVGSRQGALRIDVLYYDARGRLTQTRPVIHTASGTDWEPTGFVGIDVFDSEATGVSAPVAFRFTPLSRISHFQIDDVYVDPRGRG
jgi:hypothetical protein